MPFDCQKLTEAVKTLQQMKRDFDTKYRDGININTRNSLDKKEAIVVEIIETIEGIYVSEKEAKKIFGDDYFGPDEIRDAFLDGVDIGSVPKIPFSNAELKIAKELSQMLILRVDIASEGSALNMEKIYEIMGNEMKGGSRVWSNRSWFVGESFYKDETPKAGWALVSKTEMAGSNSKNYVEQNDEIVEYLERVCPEKRGLDRYQKAIDEYRAARSEIESLLDSDYIAAMKRLESLELTRLTRRRPVEVVYDLILYFQKTGVRLMCDTFAFTSRCDSDGRFVLVGDFGDLGVSQGILLPKQFEDKPGIDQYVFFARTI
jgi:hypothetical protein